MTGASGAGSDVGEFVWWAQREGLLRAARHALHAVRVRLFALDLFEVYVADLALPPPPVEMGPGQQVRVVEPGDEAAIRGLVGPRAGAKFAARLQRRDTCMLCLFDGELAYFTWLNVGRGGLVEPGPDEGYIFDSRTLAPFRGRGIHTSMMRQCLTYLARKGCRRAFIGVSFRNAPARHVLRRKLPFSRSGFVLYLSLWGRELRLPVFPLQMHAPQASTRPGS